MSKVNAPRIVGMPMIMTIRQSILPSRTFLIEPVAALKVLIIIFVPADTGTGNPNRKKNGNLIVPNARPTNPPRSPTIKEIKINTSVSQRLAIDVIPKISIDL